jgi:predicted 3-demethylubiquinone-9 3-methyltransferase (glyoxalase superfamily)
MENSSHKINPFLWFDNHADEAAGFYISIFPDSRITGKTVYKKEGFEHHGRPEGSTMTVSFKIGGQDFVALNGGPFFEFSPAVSFFVTCESVHEVDWLWKELSFEGRILMPLDKYDWSEKYGWVQDRFGVSWQISLGSVAEVGQKIAPSFLFCDKLAGKGVEAVNYYTSVFRNSLIDGILLYGSGEAHPEGLVKHSQFAIEGYKLMLMESGMEHGFTVTGAISFMINCEDQKEVDHYWEKLTDGGDPEAQRCGWLSDRYGIYWQVVPEQLEHMLNGDNIARAERVTAVMMQMKKLDLKALEKAYNGK